MGRIWLNPAERPLGAVLCQTTQTSPVLVHHPQKQCLGCCAWHMSVPPAKWHCYAVLYNGLLQTASGCIRCHVTDRVNIEMRYSRLDEQESLARFQ